MTDNHETPAASSRQGGTFEPFLSESGVDAQRRVFVVYEVRPGWFVRASVGLREPFDGPSEVSVSYEPNPSEYPVTDGITTEILRAVPLARIRRQLTALRAAEAANESTAEPFPQRMSEPHDLARFAASYARLVAQGRRQPLMDLSTLYGLSRNTVSARIRRARESGLLTRPTAESLGELTGKALHLLDGRG